MTRGPLRLADLDHAGRYAALRAEVDAALAARPDDADAVVTLHSDGRAIARRRRAGGDPPPTPGHASVLVYVRGIPLWGAEHPLPPR